MQHNRQLSDQTLTENHRKLGLNIDLMYVWRKHVFSVLLVRCMVVWLYLTGPSICCWPLVTLTRAHTANGCVARTRRAVIAAFTSLRSLPFKPIPRTECWYHGLIGSYIHCDSRKLILSCCGHLAHFLFLVFYIPCPITAGCVWIQTM